jgi:hypothetical protein
LAKSPYSYERFPERFNIIMSGFLMKERSVNFTVYKYFFVNFSGAEKLPKMVKTILDIFAQLTSYGKFTTGINFLSIS